MFTILRILVSVLIACALGFVVIKASAIAGPYVGFVVCLAAFGFVGAHAFESATKQAKEGINSLERKYNDRRR